MEAGLAVRRLDDGRVDVTGLAATPVAVEQSNTSIRFGDAWVVKLNRRLTYGPSPELELAPLLNRWSGQRCSPRTSAALDIATDRGTATLAVLTEFVENVGDGWKVVLEALRAEAAAGSVDADNAGSLGEVAAVAVLTGDLHAALSLETWATELGPERITTTDAARWQGAALSALDEALSDLQASLPMLSDRSRRVADLVSGGAELIRVQLAGFEALTGSKKIRTHGDYHLGQVLRTSNGAYVAIDFDGEPLRSLDERRAKYSPLRDVAGMLRSLGYAVGTVQSETDGELLDAELAGWERAARALFLTTYLERLAANGVELLPREREQIRRSVSALEIEKAVYEVVYELNNRPAWVWIPLSRLVSTR